MKSEMDGFIVKSLSFVDLNVLTGREVWIYTSCCCEKQVRFFLAVSVFSNVLASI